MKKRRILLASVLKPVDEPRMYERMGQTLAANGYEVFIIGSAPTSTITNPKINFISHRKFGRLSLQRIMIRIRMVKNIFKVKPDILIVATHELLGVALLYKLFFQKKIVYDVQENYRLNIIHTVTFPKILRWYIASFVRLKEMMLSPIVSHFILAEKCYAQQMPFVKNKFTIVENKCKRPMDFKRVPNEVCIQLIFTGTLAESTGVFEAIRLAKKMHEKESNIRLHLIGHAAQSTTLQKIEKDIAQSSFITLTGGNEFVSHQLIFEAIATAHFGIIFYPTSAHTENKIPSKLYEYLSCELPILLQNYEPWKKICEPQHASIAVDFTSPSIPAVINQMNKNKFYTTNPTNVTWQSEENKFLSVINSI